MLNVVLYLFILHAYNIIQFNVIMTLIYKNIIHYMLHTYIVILEYIILHLDFHYMINLNLAYVITKANSDTFFVSVLVRVWVHDLF